MPVSDDKSGWKPEAGNALYEEGEAQPHLFAVSDAGSSALRILPGLCVGESTEGELIFDAENNQGRWLAFGSDDAGFWVETARNGVQLSSLAGGAIERQALVPGLVLEFPHNRLLISQDSLAHPLPGPVISVEQSPQEEADGGHWIFDEMAEISGRSAESMPVDFAKPPKRVRPGRGRYIVVAVVLAMLAVGVTQLDLGDFTGRDASLLDPPIAAGLDTEATTPTPQVTSEGSSRAETIDEAPISVVSRPETDQPAGRDTVVKDDGIAGLLPGTATPAPQTVPEQDEQPETVALAPARVVSQPEVVEPVGREKAAVDELDVGSVPKAATPAPRITSAETVRQEIAAASLPAGPSAAAPETGVVTTPLLEEKISISASMVFEFDSAELSADAKAVIDDHIQKLENEGRLGAITRIEGHTDNSGPEAYNQYLSRQRAQTVTDYIVSQTDSVLVSDIEVIGKGGSEPVASNDSREGRIQNRRVDIYVETRTAF